MSAVQLVEVGPRDGLQNAAVEMTPAARGELVSRLAGAGVARIEAVSFVDPTRVPQMAGAEEVVARLAAVPGVRYCGLVLNDRGYERLVESGLDDVRFTFAISDAFNWRNSNATTAQGLDAARTVVRRASASGRHAGVVLATAFGCPFAGEVNPGAVLDVASEVAAAGAHEIVFADTIGVAVPGQIRTLLEAAAALGPTLGVHLHNTRNTGYANAYTALEAGARVLDTSVGGLGGCPFAPKATGNIATEDVVYLLEREGIDTGIDLDAVIATALWLRKVYGLELDGQLHRVDRFPPSTPARA